MIGRVRAPTPRVSRAARVRKARRRREESLDWYWVGRREFRQRSQYFICNALSRVGDGGVVVGRMFGCIFVVVVVMGLLGYGSCGERVAMARLGYTRKIWEFETFFYVLNLVETCSVLVYGGVSIRCTNTSYRLGNWRKLQLSPL